MKARAGRIKRERSGLIKYVLRTDIDNEGGFFEFTAPAQVQQFKVNNLSQLCFITA